MNLGWLVGWLVGKAMLTTKAGFSIQLRAWLLYIFARFKAHFTSRPFHLGNSLNFHTLLGHRPVHGLGGILYKFAASFDSSWIKRDCVGHFSN